MGNSGSNPILGFCLKFGSETIWISNFNFGHQFIRQFGRIQIQFDLRGALVTALFEWVVPYRCREKQQKYVDV